MINWKLPECEQAGLDMNPTSCSSRTHRSTQNSRFLDDYFFWFFGFGWIYSLLLTKWKENSAVTLIVCHPTRVWKSVDTSKWSCTFIILWSLLYIIMYYFYSRETDNNALAFAQFLPRFASTHRARIFLSRWYVPRWRPNRFLWLASENWQQKRGSAGMQEARDTGRNTTRGRQRAKDNPKRVLYNSWRRTRECDENHFPSLGNNTTINISNGILDFNYIVSRGWDKYGHHYLKDLTPPGQWPMPASI